ncbi:MAG: hypothetical protein ACI4NM_07550 [Bullifex sp.]
MDTLIICLDRTGGRTFGGRRQSEDREIRKKMLSLFPRITCDPYTGLQFENSSKNQLMVKERIDGSENAVFMEKGNPDNYCFRHLIVFRFHRDYPSTEKYDPYSRGFRLVAKEDFAGYSHDIITMEEYVK